MVKSCNCSETSCSNLLIYFNENDYEVSLKQFLRKEGRKIFSFRQCCGSATFDSDPDPAFHPAFLYALQLILKLLESLLVLLTFIL